MVKVSALGLAFVVALAGGGMDLAADVRAVPARAQTQYDDKHDVAYSLARLQDGGVQLSGQSPELDFQKTSYQDGRFELRLTSHGDVVSFTVDPGGVRIARGNRTLNVSAGATEGDFDKARTLLAGSRAVKRYRQLAAALEAAPEDTPASHSTLIGAAIVSLLDGDSGAPARIARRLAQKTAAGVRKAGRAMDCWQWYEGRTYDAMVDYWDCVRSADWWDYEIVNYACSFRWAIRAEGYWFQFLGCSSFPF